MSTAEVRRYWTRLVVDGCLICGMPAEIAHCHGGSIVERMQEPKAKGRKLPRYDWLVLPLCPSHGRIGPLALDTDVIVWEARYGKQASHLVRIGHKYGIDLFAKANEGRKSVALA